MSAGVSNGTVAVSADAATSQSSHGNLGVAETLAVQQQHCFHVHDEDHANPQQSQSSHGNLGLAEVSAVQQQHCLTSMMRIMTNPQQSSHGNLGLAGALAVQQQHCPHKHDEGNGEPTLPARE